MEEDEPLYTDPEEDDDDDDYEYQWGPGLPKMPPGTIIG